MPAASFQETLCGMWGEGFRLIGGQAALFFFFTPHSFFLELTYG